MFKSFRILFSFLMIVFFTSCKKDKIDVNAPTPTSDRSELTKDSIFLYAKEVYLWNTSLPTYSVFKPRSYNSSSNQLDNFNQILLRLTKYSNFENVPGYPNETKYSYIEDLVASGQIAFKSSKKASVNLNGDGDDTGLNLSYVGSETNYKMLVRSVSPGSYAEEETNISRGDTILTINGKLYGRNFDAEIDEIVDALEQNSVTITGRKREAGGAFNLVLNKTKYTSSPILKDSVYVRGSKKIGYLAYARFSDEENSVAALNAVFQRFSTENVTDLVIDVRYNGGGFVSTAEHLTNLIAPSSLSSKKMFTEYYNSTMQSGQARILKNQPRRDARGNITSGNYYDGVTYSSSNTNLSSFFSKANAGYLNNIQNVVFIVGTNTASSSELVINSLKPHMNVKLVGRQTYGKPVGFFPIRIDKYDVYFSMFETRNSTGQVPNYYNGFVPDKVVNDDFRYNFGDTRENNLAHALHYLVNGSFSGGNIIASAKGARLSAESSETKVLDERGLYSKDFKGMIHLPAATGNNR